MSISPAIASAASAPRTLTGPALNLRTVPFGATVAVRPTVNQVSVLVDPKTGMGILVPDGVDLSSVLGRGSAGGMGLGGLGQGHAPINATAAAGWDERDLPNWVRNVPEAVKPELFDAIRPGAKFSTLKDVAPVAKAQKFFEALGVTAAEGNDENLPVVVHPKYPNAAFIGFKAPEALRNVWKGTEFLLIGSNREKGVSFMDAPDVLYHEYSHRVMDKLIGFKVNPETGKYVNPESGPLNESLADTFAAAIDGDFLMGQNVGVTRDMLRPETDIIPTQDGGIPSPGHVDFQLRTSEPHANMGIPNKAAALIGTKLGVDKMATIYMDTVRNYLEPTSGFADAALGTYIAASKRYGKDSAESAAVQQAWEAVGLRPSLDGVTHSPSQTARPVAPLAARQPRAVQSVQDMSLDDLLSILGSRSRSRA